MLRRSYIFKNNIIHANANDTKDYLAQSLFYRIFPNKKIVNIKQTEDKISIDVHNQMKLKCLLILENKNIRNILSKSKTNKLNETAVYEYICELNKKSYWELCKKKITTNNYQKYVYFSRIWWIVSVYIYYYYCDKVIDFIKKYKYGFIILGTAIAIKKITVFVIFMSFVLKKHTFNVAL
jgi:hypothetical protein